jgi:transposase
LAPALAPGDVVLDNRAAHKSDGVRQAIAAAGASILYLPPYSPDLNPIEQLPSSRGSCASSPPVPKRNSGRPSATCSPACHQGECANYLNLCGYGST